MKKYKLISFDMFQTIVDVDTQKDAVLHRLFGNDYSPNKADKLWKDFNNLIFSYFHKVSEGNEEFMTVTSVFDQFSFDYVFTSEEYQSYKSDSSSVLFNAAFSTSGIQPHEMLHIGDGLSDIAGSKLAGADAAWINRSGKEWMHDITPDYMVTSFLELPI